MAVTIKNIHAYEIIDSRGYPTLEGVLTLSSGQTVVTSVPSGTSIGRYECLELRDNNPSRFLGFGVSKAVSYINDLIGPKLLGVSPTKQKEVDDWLILADGTKNKSRLGSNTTLLISQLLLKSAAVSQNVSLFSYVNSLYCSLFSTKIVVEKIPTPLFDVINGGRNGYNNLEFQEFMIIPTSSLSFSESYQQAIEFYHELKKVLAYRNANIAVGEEGGLTPNFASNYDAFEVMKETCVRKNLKMGLDVFFGVDLAADSFYQGDRYVLREKPHPLKRDEHIASLLQLTKMYSILILEDPLSSDDWEGWKKLNAQFSDSMYLVGDDLLSSSKSRVERAIKEETCSAVLIKPNQVGTISEIFEIIDLARKNNLTYILSHRSGETNDDWIADFAVGVQAEFVKFGAPTRGERVAKYNRLWTIEREFLTTNQAVKTKPQQSQK